MAIQCQNMFANVAAFRQPLPCASVFRSPGRSGGHQLVLEAVNPASLEVALEVFEELRSRQAEVDRLRRAQVERAREEAELAQRQYMLARPENRLVVDTLERRWNEKLMSLSHAESSPSADAP